MKRFSQPPRLLFICHNVMPHDPGRLGRALTPVAARLALEAGDGYVVHSESDGEQLRSLLPGSRYTVSPLPTYAPLTEMALPALPFDLPTDRPLLLFAGYVRPYKGLDILIRALPHVLARQPVHLLVAGEFWQGTGIYRELLEAEGVAEAVTLIDDYLSNELLAAVVTRSDVVVLPYRSATQSAVVQLAFGRERPVITTNVGGLAEAVIDGYTGLVVPPEEPIALARAINRFFGEQLGPSFRENIRREQDRFSWERLVEQLVALARNG